MLDVNDKSTLTFVQHDILFFLHLLCLYYASQIFLLHPHDSFQSFLQSCFWPLTPPTTLNPFFVSRKDLDYIIQYSYFHLLNSSSLNSDLRKSCLSCAWWIIIPSSVRPCQSINLTCHLLSFLSSSVKGWLPLLSLYLSVSLCVQIPRLSPPDWIIQFRCHLFHSLQQGPCTLSSIQTVVLIAKCMHPFAPPLLISPPRNTTTFSISYSFYVLSSKLTAYECEEGFRGCCLQGQFSVSHVEINLSRQAFHRKVPLGYQRGRGGGVWI